MYKFMVMIVGAWLLLPALAPPALALPPTGYINNFAGVALFGECVPNARKIELRLTGRQLPLLGVNGVAADLWVVPTPGFTKVANRPGRVPPTYSALVWSRAVHHTGHVAVFLGMVRPGVARVVDCNWNLNGRGLVHDVSLADTSLLGWLVP